MNVSQNSWFCSFSVKIRCKNVFFLFLLTTLFFRLNFYAKSLFFPNFSYYWYFFWPILSVKCLFFSIFTDLKKLVWVPDLNKEIVTLQILENTYTIIFIRKLSVRNDNHLVKKFHVFFSISLLWNLALKNLKFCILNIFKEHASIFRQKWLSLLVASFSWAFKWVYLRPDSLESRITRPSVNKMPYFFFVFHSHREIFKVLTTNSSNSIFVSLVQKRN
jgi:hypothetical protein